MAFSTLDSSPGRNPNIARVDPRLVEIVSAAASGLPNGYRVTINEGYNSAGHVPNSQHHIAGRGALDVQIWDPNGNAIPNRGTDNTGMYTKLAQGAYGYMLQTYPDLKGQLGWGGAFGIGRGSKIADLMHFDLGGDRGTLGPRLSQLARYTPPAGIPNPPAGSIGAPITASGSRVLRKGMTDRGTGGAVTALQQQLQAAGFNPGKIDGVYGPQTAAAVRQAEAQFGLARDRGVAGPQVLTALNNAGMMQDALTYGGPTAPGGVPSMMGTPPIASLPPPPTAGQPNQNDLETAMAAKPYVYQREGISSPGGPPPPSSDVAFTPHSLGPYITGAPGRTGLPLPKMVASGDAELGTGTGTSFLPAFRAAVPGFPPVWGEQPQETPFAPIAGLDPLTASAAGISPNTNALRDYQRQQLYDAAVAGAGPNSPTSPGFAGFPSEPTQWDSIRQFGGELGNGIAGAANAVGGGIASGADAIFNPNTGLIGQASQGVNNFLFGGPKTSTAASMPPAVLAQTLGPSAPPWTPSDIVPYSTPSGAPVTSADLRDLISTMKDQSNLPDASAAHELATPYQGRLGGLGPQSSLGGFPQYAMTMPAQIPYSGVSEATPSFAAPSESSWGGIEEGIRRPEISPASSATFGGAGFPYVPPDASRFNAPPMQSAPIPHPADFASLDSFMGAGSTDYLSGGAPNDPLSGAINIPTIAGHIIPQALGGAPDPSITGGLTAAAARASMPTGYGSPGSFGGPMKSGYGGGYVGSNSGYSYGGRSNYSPSWNSTVGAFWNAPSLYTSSGAINPSGGARYAYSFNPQTGQGQYVDEHGNKHDYTSY